MRRESRRLLSSLSLVVHMPYRATSGLHLAAQNGDVAALQRLLSEGAPVDLVSEIRYVAEDSDEEVEEWPPWMCTPLHAMCGAGDERFSNPADPQWQRNFRHEHMQCVKLLIAHGADPNVIMLHLTIINLGPLGMRDKGIEIISLLCKAGAPADAEHAQYGTTLEYAVWVNHRRLWPFFFRLGVAYPRPPDSMPDPRITGTCYAPRRAHPYLGKIEAAGGWKKYERAHLRSLSATFVPKFPHLPAEIVPLIVQFWAHVGDY